jgi:hypothetical protein
MAKKVKHPSVSSDNLNGSLKAHTIFGERETHFLLEINKGLPQISVRTSSGQNLSKKLNSADAQFIFKEFAKLNPVAPKLLNECQRSKIEISLNHTNKKSQVKRSCLVTTKQKNDAFVRFANILTHAVL